MPKTDCKIIFEIPTLEDWLELSKPTIYKLMRLGLPYEKLEGSTWFHVDNVNDWFRQITNNPRPNMVKNGE